MATAAALPISGGALHSEAAKLTAKLEGEHHLEGLRNEGLLGLRRAVRITVRPLDGSTPKKGEKVVHLIRHGQGFHNLFSDLWKEFGQKVDITDPKNPYNRPEVLDPPLTAIGRQQAQALQPLTKRLTGVQLVVVSPLRRAVETSLLAFPHLLHAAESDGGLQDEKKKVFLGREECHEEVHSNICDMRRPLSEIKAEFPMVDWSEILEEEDPVWDGGKRESGRSVSDRAYAFMLWLRARPEVEVAIGTHSAWLFNLLNTVMDCSADPRLAEWFLTGELRSVLVAFDDQQEMVCSVEEPKAKCLKTTP